MKKRILAMLLLVMTIFVGCAGLTQEPVSDVSDVDSTPAASTESSNVSTESSDVSADASDVSVESTESSEPEVSDEPEVLDPKYRNILTGLYDLTDGGVGKRPVSIMVNNIAPAMPQYGIGKADVIFEIPVEGYQTRLMCMYGDYSAVPQVCSVRSCRKYFAALAVGFDSLYVNFGQAAKITPYVDSIGVLQIDSSPYGYNLFIRDKDRLNAGYALEHTMYFDAPKLPEMCKNSKIRTDLAKDKQGMAFNFPESVDEVVIPNGEECKELYIDFGVNESGFIYNEETKTYAKTYYNSKKKVVEPHIDSRTGEQLNFTNVLVLHTPVAFDQEHVRTHRYINWKGGKNATAYYISNGVKQKIYWTKNSEKDSMKFYDMNGKELTINCGKTYICFNEIKDVDFK